MIGEIRLGFHVDGIGFYRGCSELIYKVDSSSNLRVFKEGEIIEMDESLFKIESIELAFIPYPGRKNFERQKPIKLIYVSKASVLTGDAKIRNAVKLKDLEPMKDLDIKEEDIKVDKGYNKEEFKEEFAHVIRPEKPKKKLKRRTRTDETPIRKEAPTRKAKAKTEKKAASKSEVTKKSQETEMERKKRTTKRAKGIKKVPAEPIKKATKARTKVKAKSKAEDSPTASKKLSRRKRCPGCKGLFKSLGRHKCKMK